nr:ankyrin repeat-containing protein [Tanacetum cinerariifolium]
MCTLKGRALTWWNKSVQTLGLANANQIPCSNLKAMMTNEYCPATEIQKMEQELWTLSLKRDDIEAYNNRFHELALMCPKLVPTERKKIEKYVRGFPERIKGNITSSKPTTLHDAINMARELVEQAVQGRATRIGESNKRKWEDHQRNTNNNNPNNNNNRHFKDKCPKGRNQQNEGARGRAYVVVENPQQNPNVVAEKELEEYMHASNVNVSNFVSVKLSGRRNYDLWKAQMLSLLDKLMIRDIVENRQYWFKSKSEDFVKKYDILLRGWILGSLSEEVLRYLDYSACAHGIWVTLEDEYCFNWYAT